LNHRRWRPLFAGGLVVAGMLAVGVSLRAAGTGGAKRTMERINLSSTGAEADAANVSLRELSMSAEGRFVAFASDASNLVAGDDNGVGDVFVRDRLTGTTERVSVGPNGTQANAVSLEPAISADGRFVAFVSPATNLVVDDTNSRTDIFVRDRKLGTTERVSVSESGVEGNGPSEKPPAISADGRFVVFASLASNLVTGDTNGLLDVFLKDRETGSVERISVATGGAQATGGDSGGRRPSISADGNMVAFVSQATNLVSGDTNGVEDVFVRDREAGSTERVSESSFGAQADAATESCSISGNGQFVVFQSSANNLVQNDTHTGGNDIFLRDLLTDTTELINVSSGGEQGTLGSNSFASPAISADGSVVAFYSDAGNLVPNDTNGVADVFLRDRLARTTTRVNVGTDGTQTHDDSDAGLAMSSDGRLIVFRSAASNLLLGDNNGLPDLFLTERSTVPPARIAVFRPTTREWFVRDDDGSPAVVAFGGPGDMPAPADYFGLGRAQIAVYRPSSGEWFLRTDAGTRAIALGVPNAQPVPGDYLGTGRAQVAVFAPATGQWTLRDINGSVAGTVAWGAPDDVPVPADYLGQHRVQFAVFRPTTGEWIIRAGAAVVLPFGGPGDLPVPGDYFDAGRSQLAVFRPTTREWFIRNDDGSTTRIPFGGPGDLPMPADYLKPGKTEIAVYRPSAGAWFIRQGFGSIRVDWGGANDQPLPAPFRVPNP
jgi:Tol biopolymer transport system component